jgi:C-terminal processing protease CtpA/Prc
MPIFGWFNWSGQYLEGSGVIPDLEVGGGSDASAFSRSQQLSRAIEAMRAK